MDATSPGGSAILEPRHVAAIQLGLETLDDCGAMAYEFGVCVGPGVEPFVVADRPETHLCSIDRCGEANDLGTVLLSANIGNSSTG